MTQHDVVIGRDAAGWYVGSVPALPGCHTQARSLEELMIRVRAAAELCLEVAAEDTGAPPAGEPLEFVGLRRVSVGAAA